MSLPFTKEKPEVYSPFPHTLFKAPERDLWSYDIFMQVLPGVEKLLVREFEYLDIKILTKSSEHFQAPPRRDHFVQVLTKIFQSIPT